MDTPAPEQLDLLRQARRASLMKVWASGSRRLSADEPAEISDFIETEASSVEAAAPAPESPARADTEATAEKHDPCPLDHPTQMPLWWATNMKHRVPEKILATARLAAAEAPPPAVAESLAPSPLTLPPNGRVAAGDDLFALVSLEKAITGGSSALPGP